MTLWKKVTMCRPHLRNWELCSTSLKMEYLHKLHRFFGILLYRMFVYFHPFIKSFINTIWTHGYSFYTLSYDPILLYFLAHIVPTLALGFLSIDSSIPLKYLHHCVFVCLFVLSTFLLSGTIRCFWLIFCIPCPHYRISHFFKEPWIFH